MPQFLWATLFLYKGISMSIQKLPNWSIQKLPNWQKTAQFGHPG